MPSIGGQHLVGVVELLVDAVLPAYVLGAVLVVGPHPELGDADIALPHVRGGQWVGDLLVQQLALVLLRRLASADRNDRRDQTAGRGRRHRARQDYRHRDPHGEHVASRVAALQADRRIRNRVRCARDRGRSGRA
jgi:hypothetical protein